MTAMIERCLQDLWTLRADRKTPGDKRDVSGHKGVISYLAASEGTEPWMRTISPGRKLPRMVPANGIVCTQYTYFYLRLNQH